MKVRFEMKRIVAGVLCFCMMVGLLPGFTLRASAAEERSS